MSTAYFQDELRYLRDVGPEFARTNPEIARFLSDRGSDPDVERLLEGVAFLCGRIRQKLDDELPELTHSMMSLLWPHYLRPIPSMSILELLPEMQGMQGARVLEQGAEFASVPVDGTRCRFRSSWQIKLRPWVLADVILETAAAKPVRLILRLRTASKAQLGDIELDRVRFHLAGDPRTAFVLYLLAAAHLDFVTVSDGSSQPRRPEVILPAESVQPASLTRDEAVLPYPARSFPGYRLMQEYLAFKSKFLFLDLTGLDRAVRKLELTDNVELAFTFNRRLESYPLVSRENVRLHCVPIVNLFSHPADPIRLQHDRVKYLIQPSKTGIADRRHAEVYSADRVYGLSQTQGVQTHEFKPFYSFDHEKAADPRLATYYQTHVVPGVYARDAGPSTDTYVSFVTGTSPGELPEDETISIELTCTNRCQANELRAGDITEPTDSSPSGVTFRNLVKPTANVPPPLGKGLHWRLISHMSLNYVSLVDVARFKELLRVYDFQSAHDAQEALAHHRMLDGIVAVRSKFKERLVRGAPIRGISTEIELNEDHFAGEGDAYLFSTIIDRFLGLYVTLNAYSELKVRFTRSGQIYRFAPRWGEQFTPAEGRSHDDEV